MDKMPWFRFYAETFSDTKFQRVARELQLDKTQIIGAWTIILCLASQSPYRGKLYITRSLRSCYAIEDLCYILGYEPQITGMLLDQFINLEMVNIDENGAFCITNWDKRQFKSDETDPTAAERMRKSRALRDCYAPVTKLLRPETETETESDSILEEHGFQHLLETIVGLPATPSDLPDMDELERMNIQEDDIRGALQWRKENGRGPVKRLSQLFPGIKVEYSKRVQDDNARGNGSKPHVPMTLEEENAAILRKAGLA